MMPSLKQLKFKFYAHGPKTIFLLIWLGLNIFLFAYDYYQYDTATKYTYLRKIVGEGLPFARGSAACLNLNCALIVLCVCRNFLSLIHNSEYCPRVIRRLINHNLALHKLCAWSIVLHTIIHTLAHTFNVEFGVSFFKLEPIVAPDGSTGSELKAANFVDQKDTVYTVLFGSVGGLTGVIIDVCLFLMVTSSIKIVRRSFFEVFWFTHHLFIVFFICLLFHASGQMITSLQGARCITDSNGGEWCNYKCDEYLKNDAKVPDDDLCVDLVFKGPGYINYSKSYWWVGVPLIIYAIDRIVRWTRRFNPAVVYKAIEHPGPCLELRMRKRGWKQQAGQYVFLQCSELSLFEWHPFTLTSAPEENYLSVHIRKSGDWTGALLKTVGKHSKAKTTKEGKNAELNFRIAVDGPYGTPSDDIFKYKTTVLIGAGVGVTPYASILKSVWYKLKSGNYNFGVKKIYFYWLCSDASVFGWFTSVIKEVVNELKELDCSNYLEVRPHLTRFNNDKDMMENVAMNMDSEEDAITSLPGVQTRFGRPNWFKDFVAIGQENEGTDIGVFFCGPAILSESLDKACSLANAELEEQSSNSMFFYNKENF